MAPNAPVIFQSTLPARGATISSHILIILCAISIHAPREGSDVQYCPPTNQAGGFQSTLPARGATGINTSQIITSKNFNPRSPRGERLRPFPCVGCADDFNPRSPRGERLVEIARGTRYVRDFNPRSPRGERPSGYDRNGKFVIFQSTLPARGATGKLRFFFNHLIISIHAPREGSDAVNDDVIKPRDDFNPRSPRGERQGRDLTAGNTAGFQSTLPARGATQSR